MIFLVPSFDIWLHDRHWSNLFSKYETLIPIISIINVDSSTRCSLNFIYLFATLIVQSITISLILRTSNNASHLIMLQ